MITVVGLGPADVGHMTRRALEAIESADSVFLRTARHPAAQAIASLRPDATSFDALYETADSFEEVYASIVAELLAAEAAAPKGGTGPCYAVPGSPMVAERTVELLTELSRDGRAELVVEPALSYLDLVWARLGLDPVAAGVALADGASFAVTAAGSGAGPVLVSQVWSTSLLSEMKLALDDAPEGQEAVILHHLGLVDERVERVAWEDLDRVVEPDHLTSVFVPGLARPPMAAVAGLAETVAFLIERCPWDREQTHRSLLKYMLEETYEAMEALDALGDEPENATPEAVGHAEEELGDLLCQVVFHATLGAREGLFTLGDVARSIDEKLISRHPHVFGDVTAHSADDVVRNWERQKDQSKQRTHLLEGIPAAMPALARADKAERKLESVGLGWDRSGESREALVARLGHLYGGTGEDGPGARRGPARDEDEEAGDLLLLVARMCASLQIDPEAALRRALERLGGEVRVLEAEARQSGAGLAEWLDSDPVHERQLPLC